MKQWALHANGLFPVVSSKAGAAGEKAGEGSSRAKKGGPPEFVKWSEAAQDEAKEHSVKWGKIKTVERAIEKLLRSYKADVSRLLDVCRQSIIFDSIADLSRCVEAVSRDPDIKIVRIKNR